MKIPGGNRISSFQGAVHAIPVRQPYVAAQQNGKTAHRFDKVTISGTETGHSSFEMQLTGRISQDVRAATTTGSLSSLRQEIESGSYQPDPNMIARKMLFFEEA